MDFDELEFENYRPETEESSYYKENIFNLEDLYLFWAVLEFYCFEASKNEQVL